MITHDENAFYAWLIIIGAVCVTVLIGAAIDRFYLKRRHLPAQMPANRTLPAIIRSESE